MSCVTRDLSNTLWPSVLWPASLVQQYRPASTVYDGWPTMIQSCLNVGSRSARHYNNIGSTSRVCWEVHLSQIVGLIRHRWPNVVSGVPALKQRWLHVIVQRYACLPVWSVCPKGIHNNTQLTQGDVESMLVQRLSTIYDVGPTLSQLWFNVLSLLACQYTCMGPI